MSYADLWRLNVRFRPIDEWPGEPTSFREWSRFRAPFSKTVALLARELDHLGAEQIVLQVALREQDIRNDGFPRANARAASPGVILAFESKWGPLKYATDLYTEWTDNLRAIAKSMEALRAVDRYGVSRRGEQYQGWKALMPTGGLTSTADAQAFLDQHGGLTAALKTFHPDNPETGDREMFDRVMQAKARVA